MISESTFVQNAKLSKELCGILGVRPDYVTKFDLSIRPDEAIIIEISLYPTVNHLMAMVEVIKKYKIAEIEPNNG